MTDAVSIAGACSENAECGFMSPFNDGREIGIEGFIIPHSAFSLHAPMLLRSQFSKTASLPDDDIYKTTVSPEC